MGVKVTFRVDSVARHHDGVEVVELSAMPEGENIGEATVGSIKMCIPSADAKGQFVPGELYNVGFEKAEGPRQ